MASPNFYPYFPPPPSHPLQPPPPRGKPPRPPHVQPPPTPLPPSPSPDNHTTVIVIVFVSFGGLFLLAFFAAAICCFIKKKKKKKTVEETDIIRADEHMKVKEAIVEGPHGTKAVVLEIEDDVHIDEVIRKDEKCESKDLHDNKSSSGIEVGASSSASINESKHPQLENKV